MNKLKAVFISTFVTFVIACSGYAAWRAFEGPALPWVGVLLTTLPMTVFFVRLYVAGDVARTSPRLHGLIALAALGVAFGGASFFVGDGDPLALVLALIGLSALITYSYWYSSLPRPTNAALRVGQPLPAFQLETEDAQVVDSSSFLGRPLVLLFYRGNWCPLCMAQIREVAALYRELEARGAQVVLASPQPHDNTRGLAAKFDVPFRFLVDRDHAAAKRLGIFAEDGLPAGLQALGYDSDTVWPTVVVTDGEGRVLMADLTDNYRVRPEPSTFLEVLDRAGAIAQPA